MAALVTFLHDLLYDGRAVLRERPEPAAASGEASAMLQTAYQSYRLEVAGPLLDFDVEIAVAAGILVQYACWFLVSHAEPDAELENHLVMPRLPRSAASHLSADLLFRYLPQIHRRARALDPADRLTTLLARTLRQWPLSGVMSDVEDGPLTGLDFDGHRGLLLLYAERLASHTRPAWMPESVGLEYVEWVKSV